MKVSIICAISLDGYLNPTLEMSPTWTSAVDKKSFAEKTRASGVMIMGNNTFKYSFHDKPLPGRWSVVVTHNTNRSTDNVWFTADKPQDILKHIKQKGYDDISIVGGGIINSLFINAGLVTDLYITISSQIFGHGVPLFANLTNTPQLQLVTSSPLGPGEVLNHYKVI